MPYYITAHYADGSQKLGNLDGQACLRSRRPDRSASWQRLGITIRASPRVKEWRLVTAEDDTILIKQNPSFKETL